MSFSQIPDDVLKQHFIPVLLNTTIQYPISVSQIFNESKNEYKVGQCGKIEYFNITSYKNLYKFSLLNRKCYKMSKEILQQAKKNRIHIAVKLFVHYLSMDVSGIYSYIKLDNKIIKDFYDGGAPILDDYISINNKPIYLYIDSFSRMPKPINEYIFDDTYISILKTIDRITFVNQKGFKKNMSDNLIYRNDFDFDIESAKDFNLYYFLQKYTLEVQYNKLTWIDIIIALYNIKSLKIGNKKEQIHCILKYTFTNNELTLYYDIS